jgi:hypothetical protein
MQTAVGQAHLVSRRFETIGHNRKEIQMPKKTDVMDVEVSCSGCAAKDAHRQGVRLFDIQGLAVHETRRPSILFSEPPTARWKCEDLCRYVRGQRLVPNPGAHNVLNLCSRTEAPGPWRRPSHGSTMPILLAVSRWTLTTERSGPRPSWNAMDTLGTK